MVSLVSKGLGTSLLHNLANYSGLGGPRLSHFKVRNTHFLTVLLVTVFVVVVTVVVFGFCSRFGFDLGLLLRGLAAFLVLLSLFFPEPLLWVHIVLDHTIT
jgi:hypothetical protein